MPVHCRKVGLVVMAANPAANLGESSSWAKSQTLEVKGRPMRSFFCIAKRLTVTWLGFHESIVLIGTMRLGGGSVRRGQCYGFYRCTVGHLLF